MTPGKEKLRPWPVPLLEVDIAKLVGCLWGKCQWWGQAGTNLVILHQQRKLNYEAKTWKHGVSMDSFKRWTTAGTWWFIVLYHTVIISKFVVYSKWSGVRGNYSKQNIRYIWKFPKIEVSLNHPFIDGVSLTNLPAIGYPPFMETSKQNIQYLVFPGCNSCSSFGVSFSASFRGASVTTSRCQGCQGAKTTCEAVELWITGLNCRSTTSNTTSTKGESKMKLKMGCGSSL